MMMSLLNLSDNMNPGSPLPIEKPTRKSFGPVGEAAAQGRHEGLAVGGRGISKIYRLEIFTAQSIRIIFDPPPLKFFPRICLTLAVSCLRTCRHPPPLKSGGLKKWLWKVRCVLNRTGKIIKKFSDSYFSSNRRKLGRFKKKITLKWP